jgi:hypothetical protein
LRYTSKISLLKDLTKVLSVETWTAKALGASLRRENLGNCQRAGCSPLLSNS